MALREGRVLTDLGGADIVRACERNYVEYWRTAGASPYAEFSEARGITYCVTGLPQEIFNVVLASNLSTENVEARVDEAIAYFKSRRIPMIWHTGLLSEPKEVSTIISSRGFPHDYDLTAMAVDLSAMKDRFSMPTGITVKEPASPEEYSAWSKCLTSSWESPKEVRQWMLSNPCFNPYVNLQASAAMSKSMFLGSVGGRPAGSAMLFWNDEIAGLQNVGTEKWAQRKGVGKAVIMAAMEKARRLGFSYVVVLSTVEGVRLYKKVGFEEFGKLPEHSMYFNKA